MFALVWVCQEHPTTHLCSSECIDRWFVANIITCARSIKDHVVEVQFYRQCMDGYLEWYLIVSCPHIIPPIEHEDDGGPSNARVLLMTCHRLHLVWLTNNNFKRLHFSDHLISLENLDGEMYDLTPHIAHIARRDLCIFYYFCIIRILFFYY